MFCPLCQAEYREGFELCRRCGAALVPADVPEDQRHPRKIVWESSNRADFERATDLLREAGVPFHVTSRGDHFLERLFRKRPRYEILVLEADRERAAFLHDARVQPAAIELPLEQHPSQRCPLCHGQFPVDYDSCPECNADLSEWRTAEDDGQVPDRPAPELVWRGSHPVAYAAAVATLIDSGIPCFTSPNNRHMYYGLAVGRPQMDIYVAPEDLDRAAALLREHSDPYVFSLDVNTNAEASSPEARGVTAAGPAMPADVEVWSGHDVAIAHAVRASLREHHLNTRTLRDADGIEEILVCSAEAGRAAAIVREILSERVESQPNEPPPESLQRKSAFRRSYGLIVSGFFLLVWVAAIRGLGRFEDLEPWRQAAIGLLILCGSLFLLGGYGYLVGAWDFRFDKPARIYLTWVSYLTMLGLMFLLNIVFV